MAGPRGRNRSDFHAAYVYASPAGNRTRIDGGGEGEKFALTERGETHGGESKRRKADPRKLVDELVRFADADLLGAGTQDHAGLTRRCTSRATSYNSFYW